jgi:transposase
MEGGGAPLRSSWDTVFRCVEHAVRWGLAHRSLDGIVAIGVDELSWKKRHKYLTLVYQLDHGRRRLLHIARDRTAKSFHGFFDMLGDERLPSSAKPPRALRRSRPESLSRHRPMRSAT